MTSQPPLTAIGDEPLEARIVAWVLGDASAFEATELERLCDERPELLVFRRRMLALDGLLAEAVTPDPTTKLSPEKRKAIDEILGLEAAVGHPQSPRAKKRVPFNARRTLLAIAAGLVLLAALLGIGSMFTAKAWKSGSPDSVRQAANSLAAEQSEVAIRELKKAVREQEDKVEERRKILANVVRSKGIIYHGAGMEEGRDDNGARSALDTSHQLESEKTQLEGMIQSLLKYDGDKLLTYASGLQLPDNAVKSLYPNYLEQKSKLELLKKQGGGGQSPEVQAQQQVTESMKKQLDEGASQLRDTLQAKLDLAQARLKRASLAKNEKRNDAIKRGLDAQDYMGAKQEFESEQSMLQQLKLKLIAEEISQKMPEASKSNLMVLQTTYPPEMIEGTPKPMILPSTTPVPAKPPAAIAPPPPAAAELAMRKDANPSASAPQNAPSPAQAAATKVTKELLAQNVRRTPFTAAPVARVPSDAFASPAAKGKAKPIVADEKPSGAPVPGSILSLRERLQDHETRTEESLARSGMASAAGAKPEMSETYGNGVGFGKGWGEGGGTGGGHGGGGSGKLAEADAKAWGDGRHGGAKPTEGKPAEFEGWVNYGSPILPPDSPIIPPLTLDGKDKQTTGLRSGDETVARDSIDAILSNPLRPGAQKESGKVYDGGMETSDKEKSNADPFARLEKKLGSDISGGSVKQDDSDGDDPIRSNPARSNKSNPEEDKVRRELYKAEGYYNLGKYSDAKAIYYNVLRVDPYNAAARRGMETLAAAKSAYYRAAYDQTRSELLKQVDKAWELSTPADAPSAEPQSTSEIFRAFNKSGTASPAEPKPAGQVAAAENNESAKLFADNDSDERVLEEKLVEAPAVDPSAEGTAAAAPYSTFSLSISDASFKMAQAAMARGERPLASSIKVEQFYNAVDYGDPAPGSSEPVAGWVEQSAHPVIPGRNLVRVALRTGAAGRSAAQALRLTLLVDQSGSMAREDRRLAMENALIQLAGLLTKQDLVTVIGFSRLPRLLADAMPGDQGAKLNALVNQAASEGGTNLEEAMKLAEQMAIQHQQAGAQNRIVLFTDGAANLGDADPARLAERVKAMRQKGLAFDIAGIGTNNLNDRLLGELARHGNGRYSVVGAAKDVDGSFARQLAGAFRPAAENVKVQVRFNPLRVGKYKLIGFEEHRLKTEDFRNDVVDAAELAAEEAGVALYQVEPLAGGSGEIGDVSVRFRDAASGRMVERNWTIPYDTSAPAFDRSPPSMQLAGLAMLAAEKLRGGPLAAAIDFKQLAAPRATVKQYYSNSRRVAEMLEMLGKL